MSKQFPDHSGNSNGSHTVHVKIYSANGSRDDDQEAKVTASEFRAEYPHLEHLAPYVEHPDFNMLRISVDLYTILVTRC